MGQSGDNGGMEPIEMTDADFYEAINDALESIPGDNVDHHGAITIDVEDAPPAGSDPKLFGLSEGVALKDRTDDTEPLKITVYRKPIMAVCNTKDDVKAQVKLTVMHEIGHFYGLSHQEQMDGGWVQVASKPLK